MRALARLVDQHFIQAAQLGRVADMKGPAVRGVEDILLELRLQLRELEHDCLELLLARCIQSDAGEPEVAQRVLDDLALHRTQGSPLLLGDGVVGAVQLLALGEIRLVGGKQRQAGVVSHP